MRSAEQALIDVLLAIGLERNLVCGLDPALGRERLLGQPDETRLRFRRQGQLQQCFAVPQRLRFAELDVRVAGVAGDRQQ